MSGKFIFKKPVKTSLSDFAYKSIHEAILKGNLKSGDRLKELELSEQMGISRGPIREALRRLENEGLVHSHPYRETVVAELCPEEAEHVFEPIRMIIEAFSAKRAYKCLTEKEFSVLKSIIIQMKDASEKDDVIKISELDLKFHEILIQNTTSPGLYTTWKSISSKIYTNLVSTGIKLMSLNDVVEEHIEYFELLKEGDPDKIDKHLPKHFS